MFAPTTAAPASAATPFKAPDVTFAGTGPGTVTATLHNPNDQGQCWAEAGVGPDNNHVFFGGSRPESLANPGQTIKTSLEGLEPGTTITAREAVRATRDTSCRSWSLSPSPPPSPQPVASGARSTVW